MKPIALVVGLVLGIVAALFSGLRDLGYVELKVVLRRGCRLTRGGSVLYLYLLWES